jgi:predicted O-methyltransferase YrrM
MATPDELRSYIADLYRRGTVTGDDGQPRAIMPSGVPEAIGEALRDLIVAERATKTIEVGLAHGLSTLFICEALLRSDHPDAHHTAVDPLQGMLFANAGLRALEAAGVSDMVDHIDLSSDLALPHLLMSERGAFDLAFVDGAHFFDYAFVDSFFCMQLVKPGGLVILDDTWMPGPYLAARYLVTNLGLERVSTSLPQSFKRVDGKRERTWPHVTVLRTPRGDGPPRPANQFIAFTEPPDALGRQVINLAKTTARSVKQRVRRR